MFTLLCSLETSADPRGFTLVEHCALEMRSPPPPHYLFREPPLQENIHFYSGDRRQAIFSPKSEGTSHSGVCRVKGTTARSIATSRPEGARVAGSQTAAVLEAVAMPRGLVAFAEGNQNQSNVVRDMLTPLLPTGQTQTERQRQKEWYRVSALWLSLTQEWETININISHCFCGSGIWELIFVLAAPSHLKLSSQNASYLKACPDWRVSSQDGSLTRLSGRCGLLTGDLRSFLSPQGWLPKCPQNMTPRASDWSIWEATVGAVVYFVAYTCKSHR